ncbi:hypothetical protein ACFX14_037585 [Malus domestica]
MSQLRLISLCTLIYKIMAKVLTNLFKSILPRIISSTQSAFILGRLISDNYLVATEVAYYMHKTSSRMNGLMALKLDVSKVYDHLKWNFLEAIMIRMRFSTSWVRMIMLCVTTLTYSFKVNGEPVGYVQLRRGIRQGDPLSPYLFVMCVKGLLTLLIRAESIGALHGIKVRRSAPSIHHLFFADDSFLFARGTLEECMSIKQVLNVYEAVSGQTVNLERSCLSFSSNLTDHDQQLLALCLGMRRVEFHDKYLGLSVLIQKSKKQSFAYVKDHLWKKLHSWSGGLLSNAGRELLVKTVAQALPIYSMQCFLLPESFCEELNLMIAKFWWSGDSSKRNIHWLNWRQLCKAKQEEGLGFRDLYDFNLALLAKQAWHFIQQPESLAFRVFKARYFPNVDFLSACVKSNCSYVWRSIAAAQLVILKGCHWQVGDGSSIKIWRDNWLPKDIFFHVLSPPAVDWSMDSIMDNLFVTGLPQWHVALVKELFSQEETDLILSILLSFRSTLDRRIWHFERSGKFIVQSAYHVAKSLVSSTRAGASGSNSKLDDGRSKLLRKIWNAYVPRKFRICAWRACMNVLPTQTNLVRRQVDVENVCNICGCYGESTEHVFRDCNLAKIVWFGGLGIRVEEDDQSQFS